MVDMYKSIVVFLLTGGKTLLVPVFYEDYFAATLRLLEKLHKVNRQLTSRPSLPVHSVGFSLNQRPSQEFDAAVFVWCHTG